MNACLRWLCMASRGERISLESWMGNHSYYHYGLYKLVLLSSFSDKYCWLMRLLLWCPKYCIIALLSVLYMYVGCSHQVLKQGEDPQPIEFKKCQVWYPTAVQHNWIEMILSELRKGCTRGNPISYSPGHEGKQRKERTPPPNTTQEETNKT